MTAAPEGTLFVIDGNDVRRIRPDGEVMMLARDLRARTPATLVDRILTAAGVGERHHLMGLWPDGAGGVYVANQGARIVEHVHARGGVTTVYQAAAPYAPTGVTVGRGALYVLEYSAAQTARVTRVPFTRPTPRR